MTNRTIDLGFRIALLQKSLNLALSSVRALGGSLPNNAIAHAVFNACEAQGGRGGDHAAMVRALQRLSNFEIGQCVATEKKFA